MGSYCIIEDPNSLIQTLCWILKIQVGSLAGTVVQFRILCKVFLKSCAASIRIQIVHVGSYVLSVGYVHRGPFRVL